MKYSTDQEKQVTEPVWQEEGPELIEGRVAAWCVGRREGISCDGPGL